MAKKEKPVHVPVLRNELKLKHNDIIPQIGMQEAVLLSDSDITICGGSRGGGKSFALILDPLYDINRSNFTAIFFRKETGELEKGGGLYDKASQIYKFLGAKATKLKMAFPSGAVITFDHVQNESAIEVEKRFKGLEVPAIYIDEIDQFQMLTIIKLMQSNRNSSGIRNRILGTCNPNPSSWLRTFIDWYIDDLGLIDPAKDRVTRYFYLYGTNVTDIIWGNSREETYEKAKSYIDKSWNPRFAESGLTKLDAIKSFKFIKGDLAENKILLRSQPTYYANISSGGASAIARNLEGNWNVKEDSEEMVKRAEMEYMFDEFREAMISETNYITIDVALLGKDDFTAFIWKGLHIIDVRVKAQLDSGQAIEFVGSLLDEYGVREENCAYDNVGNGQVLTHYKRAIPVNAQAAPIGLEIAYDNLKSQLLYTFGRYLIEGKISCSKYARDKLFRYGNGTKKEKLSLHDIMQDERRALLIDDSLGKTKMANKKKMKQILGHSPNFLEGCAYRMMFELDKKKKGSFRGLQYL